MIIKNNVKTRRIYKGEDSVDRIYKGTTKVYEFLPKEYQEVKCVITDGDCYIDSNFAFNQDTSIDMTFMTPSNLPTNKTQTLFYSGSSSSNPYGFAMTSSAASGKYRVFYGGTYNGTLLNTGTKYNIKYEENKFYLDNILINTFTQRAFTVPFTMPFFAQYYQNTNPINKCYSGTKIYYIKIWDDTTIARDMIPCYRKSDNEVGFFDRVNKVFYTNLSATGQFSYESL